VTVAVCGLFEALSFTCSVPFWVPGFLGENVTLTVQVKPTPRLAPQVVLLTLNRLLVVDMPLIVSGAVPVAFDRVNANGALVVPRVTFPKLWDVGDSTALGWTPVPVNEMLAGLATSDVVTTTVPGATPGTVGENRTLRVQLLPAFRLPPIGQLVVSWNGPL
jgi:hypothetical protein